LKKYDLGKDMSAYLQKIQDEMIGINDADCMAFLLKTLPEHFG
jgi:hypothetical protein